jgi:hypothetical protein
VLPPDPYGLPAHLELHLLIRTCRDEVHAPDQSPERSRHAQPTPPHQRAGRPPEFRLLSPSLLLAGRPGFQLHSGGLSPGCALNELGRLAE